MPVCVFKRLVDHAAPHLLGHGDAEQVAQRRHDIHRPHLPTERQQPLSSIQPRVPLGCSPIDRSYKQLLYQRPSPIDHGFKAAGGELGPVGNVFVGLVSATGVGRPRRQVADIVRREVRWKEKRCR